MRGRALAAAMLTWAAIAAPAAAAPEELPLRLPDLGPGYVVNEHDCGEVLTGEEHPPSALARLDWPPACFAEFTRIWTPPGEPRGATEVMTLVWPFADAARASAAFAEARALVAFESGRPRGPFATRPAPEGLGDAAAAFAFGRRAHAAVAWRSGGVLSLVFTGARSAPAAEASALALARAQQTRIAAPAPLAPADYDDREVALDDPGLGVPVVWLGRRLALPGLPILNLTVSHGPGGPPGDAAALDYGTLALDLWRPRAFARFLRTRAGRLVRTQRCARTQRFALPGGRAVLFGGYEHPPRRCGRRGPDVWLAHVHLAGVVVTVNQPVCRLCVQGGGPYATPAALRTVIGALRRR